MGEFVLTPEDRALFEDYRKKVTELRATGIIQSGYGKVQVPFGPLEGAELAPDLDHTRSLAAVFRLFYLEQERANFRRVSKRLSRVAHLDNQEAVRTRVTEIRAAYTENLAHSGLGLEVLGENITPKEVLDLWLNVVLTGM